MVEEDEREYENETEERMKKRGREEAIIFK